MRTVFVYLCLLTVSHSSIKRSLAVYIEMLMTVVVVMMGRR